MLIRRYKPEDNPSVKALHYAGLAQVGIPKDPYHDNDLDDIEGVYINNNGDFLVGYLDGKLAAMGAIKRISATCAEIKRIRVSRDCQQRGYAQAILAKLIELAAGLGYTELQLDTMAGNSTAQHLFEKFGFVETRRGKVGTYDLVFYGKKLGHDAEKD